MAVTITPSVDGSTAAKRSVIGDKRMILGTITFGNPYTAGGEAITPAALGFDKRIDHMQVSPNSAGTRFTSWDRTNSKVLLFTAVGTEAAGDQSTITVPFMAVGE
jgi:hypothetical protein